MCTRTSARTVRGEPIGRPLVSFAMTVVARARRSEKRTGARRCLNAGYRGRRGSMTARAAASNTNRSCTTRRASLRVLTRLHTSLRLVHWMRSPWCIAIESPSWGRGNYHARFAMLENRREHAREQIPITQGCAQSARTAEDRRGQSMWSLELAELGGSINAGPHPCLGSYRPPEPYTGTRAPPGSAKFEKSNAKQL